MSSFDLLLDSGAMSTKNLHAVPPKAGTYADEFLQRLDRLEHNMALVGLTMSSVCRQAGVSRSTPDRWRKVLPHTVELMTALEGVVEARLREARELGRLSTDAN